MVFSSCQMWEIREQSSVRDNYICRKCDQLQLLTDHVVWLEKQLGTLWCMQGPKIVIDSSFREVVTLQVQADKVPDVSERVQDILKWEGKEPEVIVRTGTNDI
eukprot:g23850.t1